MVCVDILGCHECTNAQASLSVQLTTIRVSLRACLEAGFESEKSQFFDETRRLFEERTLRYGQEKQRSVIKKVAFAAQRLASKHALRPK